MNNTLEQMLVALDDAPKSRGNSMLKKHLEGEKLTSRQAILAKCADCMGYWIDGRFDCGISSCSLHTYSPYKGRVPKSRVELGDESSV